MGCGGSQLGGNEKSFKYEEVAGTRRDLRGVPKCIEVLDHEPFEFVKFTDEDARDIEQDLPGRDLLYVLTTDLVVTVKCTYDDGGRDDVAVCIPKGYLSDGASMFIPIGQPPYPRLAINSAWPVGWWLHDFGYQTVRKDASIAAPYFVTMAYQQADGTPVVQLPTFVIPASEDKAEAFRVAFDNVLIDEHRARTSKAFGEAFFASGKWSYAAPKGVVRTEFGTHLTKKAYDDLVHLAEARKCAIFRYGKDQAIDYDLFEVLKDSLGTKSSADAGDDTAGTADPPA